jgi:hypothetical protein
MKLIWHCVDVREVIGVVKDGLIDLEMMVEIAQLLGTHQRGHSRIALVASPNSRRNDEVE